MNELARNRIDDEFNLILSHMVENRIYGEKLDIHDLKMLVVMAYNLGLSDGSRTSSFWVNMYKEKLKEY